MLDEEEYRIAYEVFGQGMKAWKGGPRAEAFKEVLDYYYTVTGERETEPNAILHHRIAQYGPPCEQCGKPYRTPKSSFCAACGNRRV